MHKAYKRKNTCPSYHNVFVIIILQRKKQGYLNKLYDSLLVNSEKNRGQIFTFNSYKNGMSEAFLPK